jgi:hypothetical protein
VSLSDALAKEAQDSTGGVVYILTNPAMPGFIKIGRTQHSVSQRMQDLDNTSVPVAFCCFYAARVDNAKAVESALHAAFNSTRIRSNREFFYVKPDEVKAALELVELEDVTPLMSDSPELGAQ